jgi:small GTP-binding protein
MQKAEFTYKLCIFGEKGVGKTCLVLRYLTGLFGPDRKSTLGAAIYVKYLTIENRKIIIQIWDFGGEQQFHFLLPSYAFGSFAGIFMYDVTRQSTLKVIDDWLNRFKEGLKNETRETLLFMVGGKMDLIEQKSVSIKDAKKMKTSHEISDYFECSAKTGENVEEIFKRISQIVMQKYGVI